MNSEIWRTMVDAAKADLFKGFTEMDPKELNIIDLKFMEMGDQVEPVRALIDEARNYRTRLDNIWAAAANVVDGQCRKLVGLIKGTDKFLAIVLAEGDMGNSGKYVVWTYNAFDDGLHRGHYTMSFNAAIEEMRIRSIG